MGPWNGAAAGGKSRVQASRERKQDKMRQDCVAAVGCPKEREEKNKMKERPGQPVGCPRRGGERRRRTRQDCVAAVGCPKRGRNMH